LLGERYFGPLGGNPHFGGEKRALFKKGGRPRKGGKNTPVFG